MQEFKFLRSELISLVIKAKLENSLFDTLDLDSLRDELNNEVKSLFVFEIKISSIERTNDKLRLHFKIDYLNDDNTWKQLDCVIATTVETIN